MTSAEDYVNQVLDVMPRTTPSRAQIAMELRGHIAERVADGRPLDDVLRQLGDPAKLARSYLQAEPLERAPLGHRALAKMIDIACVVAILGPVAVIASLAAAPDWVFPIVVVVLLIGGSISFGLYTIVAEWQMGRTVGKHVMAIRVVTEEGARIGPGQAIVRQLPMFFQFYWIDVLFALFTDRRQRAFELLSRTRVVRGGSDADSTRT